MDLKKTPEEYIEEIKLLFSGTLPLVIETILDYMGYQSPQQNLQLQTTIGAAVIKFCGLVSLLHGADYSYVNINTPDTDEIAEQATHIARYADDNEIKLLYIGVPNGYNHLAIGVYGASALLEAKEDVRERMLFECYEYPSRAEKVENILKCLHESMCACQFAHNFAFEHIAEFEVKDDIAHISFRMPEQ
ncbi:hypothetical protein BNJ_00243 [Kaumoebavirus]|uniref:hypothetical protein n=1 Tax=Kaumoebavirus TaxID=1859492 RepID=UPI0009C2BC2D|nr:hypothetical protein BNJ_00243 [Kaumoebavirus]ARA72071.1 hypothetical protein BNJ_00243 [Kaumoebavirus]